MLPSHMLVLSSLSPTPSSSPRLHRLLRRLLLSPEHHRRLRVWRHQLRLHVNLLPRLPSLRLLLASRRRNLLPMAGQASLPASTCAIPTVPSFGVCSRERTGLLSRLFSLFHDLNLFAFSQRCIVFHFFVHDPFADQSSFIVWQATSIGLDWGEVVFFFIEGYDRLHEHGRRLGFSFGFGFVDTKMMVGRYPCIHIRRFVSLFLF
jgi:hypothetical protein